MDVWTRGPGEVVVRPEVTGSKVLSGSKVVMSETTGSGVRGPGGWRRGPVEDV